VDRTGDWLRNMPVPEVGIEETEGRIQKAKITKPLA
jgi:hypothetical protein